MKKVLITGCSSGFGLLTAAQFARKGDRVVATVRRPERAKELTELRDRESLPIEIESLDLLDPDSIAAAVARASADGPIDVLVNNAAIELRGPIEEIDDHEARAQFDTNVFGTLAVIRAVLPAMRERGEGVIVNVSSIAGLVARPYGGLYSASKHALEALSEALHFEVSQLGVRVALVEPGQFPTRLLDNAMIAQRFNESSPYWERSQRFDSVVGKLVPEGEPADPAAVAEMIYSVVYDPSPRLRYLVGGDAELIAGVKKAQTFEQFEQAMRGALDWWD